MTNPERESVVVEHILESRANAATAWDVATAFPTARQQLVRKALRDVKDQVVRRFGPSLHHDNQFEDVDFDSKRFQQLSFRRDTWPAGTHISISADDYRARHMSLGLVTATAREHGLDHVAAELDKNVQGRDQQPFDHFPWYYWLPDPYRHWDEREAIVRLFSEPGDASGEAPIVTFLVEHLSAVIAVADPLLVEAGRNG